MNRRAFLQSMSAAFSAMALGVRPAFAQSPPRINYDLFCDSALSYRYDMMQPWSHEGIIAASDAKILIVHPGEWSGDGSARVPDLTKLWWDEFDAPGWKELPRQQLETVDATSLMCPACMGTGRLGDGIHRVDIKDEDGDPCMGWVGGRACSQCGGCGWDDFQHREILGDGHFCPGYMNRIRTLGGVDYRVATVDYRVATVDYRVATVARLPTYTGSILLFRGDGGVKGMLCSAET
jgi:hypothetical protein